MAVLNHHAALIIDENGKVIFSFEPLVDADGNLIQNYRAVYTLHLFIKHSPKASAKAKKKGKK